MSVRQVPEEVAPCEATFLVFADGPYNTFIRLRTFVAARDAAISSKARPGAESTSKSDRPGSPEASGTIGMRPSTRVSSSPATLSPPSPPKILISLPHSGHSV